MPGQEPQHLGARPRGRKWDRMMKELSDVLNEVPPAQVPVPISEAKGIGTSYGYQGIIIIGFNFHGDKLSLTTWGRDNVACDAMADVGEQIVARCHDGTIEPGKP